MQEFLNLKQALKQQNEANNESLKKPKRLDLHQFICLDIKNIIQEFGF